MITDKAVTTTDQKVQGRKRSLFKTAGNISFAILMLVSILLAAYTLQLKILGEESALLKFKIFIVLSGSMSPEFEPGSIVLVKDVAPDSIAKGDILTFRPSIGSKNIVTHRVHSINNEDGIEITTKGDANEVQDPQPIYPENVIGKVFMSVPYLGFVLNFAGTKYGFYSLIILPCLALIIYEIFRIMSYLKPSDKVENNSDGSFPEFIPQNTEIRVFRPKSDKQIISVPYRNPERVFAGKASRVFASSGDSCFRAEVNTEKTDKLLSCKNGLRSLLEEY